MKLLNVLFSLHIFSLFFIQNIFTSEHDNQNNNSLIVINNSYLNDAPKFDAVKDVIKNEIKESILYYNKFLEKETELNKDLEELANIIENKQIDGRGIDFTNDKILVNFLNSKNTDLRQINKTINAIRALYILAENEAEIAHNKQIAKKTLIVIHPDKSGNYTDLASAIIPEIDELLLNNKYNNNLNTFMKDIHSDALSNMLEEERKKRDTLLENNATTIFLSQFTAMPMHSVGEIIGAKIIYQLIPNKQYENFFGEQCYKKSQINNLNIEEALIRF